MSEFYDAVSLRDMALTHAVNLFSRSPAAVDEYPMSLVTDAADVFFAYLKGESVGAAE